MHLKYFSNERASFESLLLTIDKWLHSLPSMYWKVFLRLENMLSRRNIDIPLLNLSILSTYAIKWVPLPTRFSRTWAFENNCFVNVIIQSLFHLYSFKREFPVRRIVHEHVEWCLIRRSHQLSELSDNSGQFKTRRVLLTQHNVIQIRTISKDITLYYV